MKYFDVIDNMQIPKRRFLDLPLEDCSKTDFDPRVFNDGIPVERYPGLTFPIDIHGRALDLFFGPLEVPIARRRVAELLDRLAPGALQRVPVTIEGDPDAYEILNVVDVVDCLDLASSSLTRMKPDESVRTDLEGLIELITLLIIDPAKAAGHHVFRLKGWLPPLIVSEHVKDELEKHKVTGVRYISVSPGDGTGPQRWLRSAK